MSYCKYIEGSLALKKVTEAVLGAHNHNFDDLEHYSGGLQRNVARQIVQLS